MKRTRRKRPSVVADKKARQSVRCDCASVFHPFPIVDVFEHGPAGQPPLDPFLDLAVRSTCTYGQTLRERAATPFYDK
jgi:hypothetical protein